MSDDKKKLVARDSILIPVTTELSRALLKFLNGDFDTTELLKIRDKFHKVRQQVNNTENMGLFIFVSQWGFSTFPLTGSILKDAGQINLTATPPKKES